MAGRAKSRARTRVWRAHTFSALAGGGGPHLGGLQQEGWCKDLRGGVPETCITKVVPLRHSRWSGKAECGR